MIVGAIFVFVVGCMCPAGRNSGTSSSTPSPTPSSSQTKGSPTSDNKSSPNKDEGDFKVEHVPVKSQKYADLARQVKNAKLLENAATQLNQALSLPTDITLRSEECGEANAFYHSDDRTITMCFELIDEFFATFRSNGLSEQKANEKTLAATRFIFLHEVGHAVIDQYKLPITGNEEDAADRCSAFINIEELGQEGIDAVFAAADAFKIWSKGATTDREVMADEHLLDEQRAYNSLCMIYGSDPDKFRNILTQDYLPRARAERCEDEYRRMSLSWANLLKPWRKA